MLPAGAALDRILESTGYLALAATTPGGVDAGDLLHAVDRVRQVVEDGGSLADAADALEADREAIERGRVAPARAWPHGRRPADEPAQGQGARGRRRVSGRPVRRLQAAGRRAHRADGRTGARLVQGRAEEGRIVRAGSSARRACGLGQRTRPTELPYLEAEEDRLLYVAATRAREVLVVSRWAGQKGTPAWGVLNGFLAKAPELQIPKLAPARCPKVLDCSTGAQADAAAAHGALRTTVSGSPHGRSRRSPPRRATSRA